MEKRSKQREAISTIEEITAITPIPPFPWNDSDQSVCRKHFGSLRSMRLSLLLRDNLADLRFAFETQRVELGKGLPQTQDGTAQGAISWPLSGVEFSACWVYCFGFSASAKRFVLGLLHRVFVFGLRFVLGLLLSEQGANRSKRNREIHETI